MYGDPAKIRTHVVKLRFSDEEYRLVQALVDYTGEQRATLLRELVMGQLRSLVEHDLDGAKKEGLEEALRSA